MDTQPVHKVADVRAGRERYVPRGIATTDLVVARAATGRPGVIVFDRAFHGRTNLTMAMTSKLVYKQGFGPLAPEIYRAPAPYPYRGVTTEDALAGLELLFKQDVDPAAVACLVLETVQGEGGFIPMPAEF